MPLVPLRMHNEELGPRLFEMLRVTIVRYCGMQTLVHSEVQLLAMRLAMPDEAMGQFIEVLMEHYAQTAGYHLTYPVNDIDFPIDLFKRYVGERGIHPFEWLVEMGILRIDFDVEAQMITLFVTREGIILSVYFPRVPQSPSELTLDEVRASGRASADALHDNPAILTVLYFSVKWFIDQFPQHSEIAQTMVEAFSFIMRSSDEMDVDDETSEMRRRLFMAVFKLSYKDTTKLCDLEQSLIFDDMAPAACIAAEIRDVKKVFIGEGDYFGSVAYSVPLYFKIAVLIAGEHYLEMAPKYIQVDPDVHRHWWRKSVLFEAKCDNAIELFNSLHACAIAFRLKPGTRVMVSGIDSDGSEVAHDCTAMIPNPHLPAGEVCPVIWTQYRYREYRTHIERLRRIAARGHSSLAHHINSCRKGKHFCGDRLSPGNAEHRAFVVELSRWLMEWRADAAPAPKEQICYAIVGGNAEIQISPNTPYMKYLQFIGELPDIRRCELFFANPRCCTPELVSPNPRDDGPAEFLS
jgi:hypothetical protein